MYKVFDTLQEYNQFTNDGANLTAGVIYYIKEDGSTHFQTNNINGEEKVYDMIDGIPEGYIKPTGNISITENGENINVNEYSTASVNVPIPDGYIVPSGNKEITQNGENIDVAQYATASVNVVPNLTTQNITENGTYQPSGNYDGFSSVTVNVAGSGGNEDLINLIERDVTNLNIPYGTTKIGEYAFRNYSKLKEITIPDSVTSIGSNAFCNCSGLTSINIPDGVTSIGEDTFHTCSKLASVTIGNGVTSIGSNAFYNCGSLTTVTIPNSVTSIGRSAFSSCDSLTTVTIPNSVTSISGYVFSYCYNLTSINIPDGVTSIGEQTFYSCRGLKSVTIPDGVTSIGTYAFSECSRLTSVTINAITPPSLGSGVFSGTNNCPIYVPAESVDAYKQATNWSSLADRISAIVA